MSVDWIPSRKITAKERGNRGFIPTSKSPIGIIEYESCIERDFYLVAIHDPNVAIIKHQPVSIFYNDERGILRKYTPDSTIRFADGTEILVEIKSDEDVRINQKKYNTRWEAAKKWANENGNVFVVITDKEIRNPRWYNIWFTFGASKCADNDKFISRLNLLIPTDGEAYNILCYNLAQTLDVEIGKAAQIICYAIYHGLVFVDTFSTRQLAKDTVIRKRIRDKKPLFRSFWQEIDEFHEFWNCIPRDGNKEENDASIKEISSDLVYGTKDEDLVTKREEIVLSWLRQPKQQRTVEWRDEFSKKWGVSKSVIYRWIEQYNNAGRKGLYPRYGNSGRRKKFDSTTLEVVENARLHYLKAGVTLKQGYLKLDVLCKSKGIGTPTPSFFNKYVYQNTTVAEFAQKKGRLFQKSNFTPDLKSFQGGLFPLQVIQMDDSPYDVFTVDEVERESLTTPNMTAAIDCYTGMITGFMVSYFSSSSRNVLEVLVQSILPKTSFVNVYETQHDWPIQGFPVVILVDNGMDFRSKAVKDFCIKYEIILEFVPLRTPRYKAFIEQWFNVLNNAMKQEPLPGLRPKLKRRLENPDLKPESEAVLTLQEIETWLHKWIVDEYNFANHYSDHVLAPYLKLANTKEGRTELIFPLAREPPSNVSCIDALYLSTLKSEKRGLTKKGILWEYLNYNSKDLAEIYKNVGNIEVSIMRDIRDIRRIWVVNPISDKPIRVGLGTGWATAILETYGNKPVQESAWCRNVKMVKELTKEKLTPYLYTKYVSEQERLALVKNAKKQQRIARKEREKMSETRKKDIDRRLASNKNEISTASHGIPSITPIKKQDPEEPDLFKTYKPRGLATSAYPRKKELVKQDDQGPESQ